MGLIGSMVRVLADDDDADVGPTTEGEGGEYQGIGWVDDLLARGFLREKGKETLEVGFVSFICYQLPPAVVHDGEGLQDRVGDEGRREEGGGGGSGGRARC